MQPFTLGRLAQAIGAHCPRRAASIACGVSTDTRAIRPGDVFFALAGENFDGARFLAAASAGGAAAAVVPAGVSWEGDLPLLRVECTRRALLDFAGWYRRALGFKVVAVTGSAGKTTTKDLIHHLMAPHRETVKAIKSFNNEVGVPLTLLRATASTEVVIVEIGTNAPGEVRTLAEVAAPDVAVITCIGASHLEGLGGIEGVEREKLSLLESLREGGSIVLNGDDPRLRRAGEAAAVAGADVTLCGLGSPRRGSGWREWRANITAREGSAWSASTSLEGAPGPALAVPLPGEHVVADALLALAVSERLEVAPAAAARSLRTFTPAPGRLGISEVGGVTVIDDTYNANPESMRAALDVLVSLAPHAGRVAVLGGMLELGTHSADRHLALGALVARVGVSHLIAVGPHAEGIARGARAAGLSEARVLYVPGVDQVPELLANRLVAGGAVLFKASRGVRLERALTPTFRLLTNTVARVA
jgi:UDP-N-acetylmuramoyl-tripeptide--D-alanyl-D-alanine ligase